MARQNWQASGRATAFPKQILGWLAMFEDWKKAWQEAIDNFQRELDDETAGPPHLAIMRREVATARKALDQLQIELERCREQVAEEEQQEQVCRRRGEMA